MLYAIDSRSLKSSTSFTHRAYDPFAVKSKPKRRPNANRGTKVSQKGSIETANHNNVEPTALAASGDQASFENLPLPNQNVAVPIDQDMFPQLGMNKTFVPLAQESVDVPDAEPFQDRPEDTRSIPHAVDKGEIDSTGDIRRYLSVENRFVHGDRLHSPADSEHGIAKTYSSAIPMGSSKELPAYQESGYDMPTSNEENYADQCDDLIETNLPVSYDGACAENDKGVFVDISSSGDVDAISGEMTTRERSPPSFADDRIPVEDVRLTKQRRGTEGLVLGPNSTRSSTAIPIFSDSRDHSGVSDEPRLSSRDYDCHGGHYGSPNPSTSSPREDNEDYGAHTARPIDESVYSSGSSGLCIDTADREGKQYKAQESHKDEKSKKSYRRSLSKRSRQIECDDHSAKKNRLSQPQITRNAMTAKVRKDATSSLLDQPFKTRKISPNQSCTPRIVSPKAKDGSGTAKAYGTSTDISYQITDIMHCSVPAGSSIVTATIRSSDPSLFLDQATLDQKPFGHIQVRRLIQISHDSWMLLGYQNDTGKPTKLNVDRKSNSRRSASSSDIDHSSSSDDENAQSEQDEPGATNHDQRSKSGRDRTLPSPKKKPPWSEVEEAYLLNLIDRQGQKWDFVESRFPNRTLGAIRLRYHMLRKNNSGNY